MSKGFPLKVLIALYFSFSANAFGNESSMPETGEETPLEQAQSSLSYDEENKQLEPSEQPSWADRSLQWMDRKHQEWSGDIVSLAHYIDGMMGSVEAVSDVNRSYLRLYFGFEESRLYDFEEQLNARFSLDLPLIKKKLRLIIENEDPVQQERLSLDSELLGDQSIQDESIYASFRHLFSSTEWQRLSFDYGVKVRLRPDLFTSARAVRTWPINDHWAFRFSDELFWYESIGLGNKSDFDFDRRLSQNLVFRVGNFVDWYQRDQRIDYGQALSLYHDFSIKRAVQYSLGLNVHHQEHNSTVSNYYVKMTYRRNLHKSWLFYQVSTGAEFPREKSYRTNPFIALRFEVLFTENVDRRLSTSLY